MSKLVRFVPLVLAAVLLAPPARADNPILQTVYTADPAPMVYNGRVYLYTGHDEDGSTYFTMKDWRVWSSADMVNWTDHGSPLSLKTFSWASQDAWAGQCVYRNGKFYWYVPVQTSNGAQHIGVAVGTSPTGPFTDPLGRALVTNSQIDPTVFIDDDGQAYLYYGNPDLYYVKLNADMISYSGSPVKVPLTTASFGVRSSTDRPTQYEEGPWLYKRSGLYYMVFAAGPISEHISYSTGPTATGPWTFRGTIMPTQGSSFTNHPGVIDFAGGSYFFYHNGALPGGGGYTRSVAVEKFSYGADGSIPTINMTTTGAPAVGTLDPYTTVQAETIAWESGVETEDCSEGGRDVSYISSGDYIKVKAVAFGAGATSFDARVASGASGGSIELHLDSLTGPLIGTCTVPGTGGWQTWTTRSCTVTGATGTHDLFLKFTGGSGNLFNFNWWKFTPVNGTTYALTVGKTGTGTGTVTSSVGGVNCGTTCSATLASGTAVTLTAAAAAGSTFGGWSGACTGSGACIVTMTAAQSVTAAFNGTTPPPPGPISINAGGAATGAFVADVDFSGGSTYSTTSAIDTSGITAAGLTAPPQAVLQSERYGNFTYTIPGLTAGGAYTVTLYFAESYWTTAGQRLFSVAINGASVLSGFDIFAAAGGANKGVARAFDTTASSSGQIVIAFTNGSIDNAKVDGIAVAEGGTPPPPGYVLTVNKTGTGSGTVAGGTISCGGTCSATLASGTTVTLTASPASGSTFGGWSGACSGSGACVVTMSQAQTVTASFIGPVNDIALTVQKAGTGTGTVTGASINCGSSCSAIYAAGTAVTLTATPASGSTFGGWSGACTGTAATCTVTMNASQTVTASFTGPTTTCKAVSGGQSGNFNTTGAICFTVTGTVNGWGCSNADGRTVTVNGTATTCGKMPLPGSSPYTFSFTAGSYPWASFYWW